VIVEASRWTDARIDGLNDRVSNIAIEVRHQSDRIDKLQHRIVTVGGSVIAALLALTVAMLGTMITLLVTHL
jgi:hypothetical protein